MTASRLCLVIEDRPHNDRERWFLEPDRPASRWSPARRRIAVQAYGQWLATLDRNGELDPFRTPGNRVTEARLRAFVDELRAAWHLRASR